MATKTETVSRKREGMRGGIKRRRRRRREGKKIGRMRRGRAGK